VVNLELFGRFPLLLSSTKEKLCFSFFRFSESEIAKLEEIMDEEKDRLLEFHRRPAIKNTDRFRKTVQKEK